jgi:outer membrane protein assembly factor BamB
LDATTGGVRWIAPQNEPGVCSLGCIVGHLALFLGRHNVTAHEVTDGSQIWTRKDLRVLEDDVLAVAQSVVACLSVGGLDSVIALDGPTGTTQWQRQVHTSVWTVVVSHDNVVVACSPEARNEERRVFYSEVVCLSLADGSRKWARDLAAQAQWRDLPHSCLNPGSVAYLMANRGSIYCSMEGGTVLCLDESTGEKQWSYHFKGGIPSPVVPVEDDVLFTFYNQIHRVSSRDGHVKFVKEIGEFRWPPTTAGFLADDAYMDSYGRELRSINPQTGDLFWKKKFPDMVTSATPCGGTVFVTCVNGELYALRH